MHCCVQNSNGSVVMKSKVPMYIIVDDDEAGEPDPVLVKPKTSKNKFARRSSVSAERYDPEADDAAEDGQEVVHHKTPEQRSRLAQAVAGILLFKSLDDSQLGRVVDAMFERRVTPNEMVIRQGDDGDNFYVIDRGRFGVLVLQDGHDKRVHQFENVGSFGELALMYNMPRSASIVAETEGVLWAMDRASFRRIVQRAAFKKRKLYEDLLKEVPMLNSLDDYERMNIADALISKSYPSGHAIMQQGDEADGMYFIEEGSVSVKILKGSEEVEVVRLHKGKYFGEVALIEDKPRTAAVYAVEAVKLAFLERESFERLLGPCLEIMKRNSSKYKKNQKSK
ncbi:CAMP-dependent protein kinase type ii regulatory subunit [Plakobranchus ocellatus]|uniref:cAMP-dependent protein kinase type II regulatory subunit n=1 Tax=Plakobranchus ocellatus TaxID=259542 RepID=A0AAV4B779_9GAST|nr:CAMP-dependent protein kinase type ii regulatory subunit [Plakobranchus ocellatus]